MKATLPKLSPLKSRKPGKAFRVSTRRAGRRTLLGKPRTSKLFPDIEEMPGMIDGQQATNLYEWRAAKALWKLGLSFDYQVSFDGGRSRAGGQVVDFVVDTIPVRTAVWIDGEYWHEGKMTSDQRMKRAIIGSYGYNIEAFFGPELHTTEAALDAMKRKFGIYA
jgi:hypothetical protein